MQSWVSWLCGVTAGMHRIDESFSEHAHAITNPDVQYVQSFINSHLKVILPNDILPIILDYFLWVLEEGSLVDVLGSTATLNMFYPASARWDVCIIEKIEKNSTICVRPLDRVHPYPYLYAGFSKPTEWIPITSSRIEPYLSRVRRPLPRDATEYDLVDVKDLKTGQYHVAEVYGNIGSALWVLAVNNYRSAEHKDNLREWICSSSKRLVRYRGSHAPRSVYNRLLPINQTINMVQPNNNNDMRVEQYVPLTISDRYSYMVVAEDTSKKSHILHLSDL